MFFVSSWLIFILLLVSLIIVLIVAAAGFYKFLPQHTNISHDGGPSREVIGDLLCDLALGAFVVIPLAPRLGGNN